LRLGLAAKEKKLKQNKRENGKSYLENALILPYTERHLQILAAPDVHALVVGTNLIEVILIDGEQTTGHRRCAQWGSPIVIPARHFSRWNSVPSERGLKRHF